MRRRIRLEAVRALPGVFRFLPEAAGREFCAGLGAIGHLWIARDRRLARGNLSRVHPEWPPERVRREARRVFEEIGRNAYDFIRYPALSEETRRALVSVEGEEVLEAARGAGRGAVLVTGHLGSWEVLAAALAGRGYPLRALARPLREPALDRALTEHRRRMGVETISSEALPLRPLRHLRRGGFLGILADQRVRREGVTVKFLGQRTIMTGAPARLAVASGAPLIPLGIRRLPDHRHRITVLGAIDPGSDPARVPELTQQVAGALGSLIGRCPEQWMWIHPRWEPRRTPASGAAGRAEGDPACAAP